MGARKQWWVACHQWAESDGFTTEDKAKGRATYLNEKASCEDPHFYWESEHAPTYNTEMHSVNIPEGASRA